MKKSVVILIAVVYIAAVALVSFFGIQAELLEETIYVNKIEIVNKDVTVKDGQKSVDVYFNGNETVEYQLDWRVYPTNATNTNVVFNYDEQKTFVSVDENGLVTFTRPGVIKISITPADLTILSEPAVITIRAMRN